MCDFVAFCKHQLGLNLRNAIFELCSSHWYQDLAIAALRKQYLVEITLNQSIDLTH